MFNLWKFTHLYAHDQSTVPFVYFFEKLFFLKILWFIYSDAGKDWGQGEKGVTEDEVVGSSPTQWTWVWASSGRRWRTGKPGVLQSMGSRRVGQQVYLTLCRRGPPAAGQVSQEATLLPPVCPTLFSPKSRSRSPCCFPPPCVCSCCTCRKALTCLALKMLFCQRKA